MRGSEAAWRSQRGDDLGVGGAVVDEAQLPAGEGLRADGGDRLFEHVQGWVVDWGQHRDQRGLARSVAAVGAAPAWSIRRGSWAAGGGGACGSMITGSTQIARATARCWWAPG